MAKVLGLLLRTTSTFVRFIELLAAATILGIFSYFLACLSRGGLPIAIWMRAVEGIAGAGTLYTLIAVFLTIFLGGITVFAFLAILLDVLFCGAFAAVAYYTYGGVHCNGLPSEAFFGNGQTGIGNTNASPKVICDLEKTCFILAIVLVALFLLSAIAQLALWMNHKKEKRYGPGPSNNYTSGVGKKSRFGRKNKNTTAVLAEKEPVTTHHHHRNADRDLELGATDMRPSADTAVDHTTAPTNTYGGPENKYFNKEHTNKRHSAGYLAAEPTVPVLDAPATHASPRSTKGNTQPYQESPRQELAGGSTQITGIIPAFDNRLPAGTHLEQPQNTDPEWVHQVSNQNSQSYGGSTYPGQTQYGRATAH